MLGSQPPSETKTCPLCGQKFNKLFKLHVAFEKKELDELAKEHPDWAGAGGFCLMCLNHLRERFHLAPLSQQDAETRLLRLG